MQREVYPGAAATDSKSDLLETLALRHQSRHPKNGLDLLQQLSRPRESQPARLFPAFVPTLPTSQSAQDE